MGLFVSEYPVLAGELVRFVNPGIVLSDVSSGSGMFAVWKCDVGHEFETSVRHRVYGHGCPYCSGSKVLKGFNDVATTNPELLNFWSSKNTVGLDEVSVGSSKKFYWVCINGHETFMRPSDRLKTFVCKECSKLDVLFLDKHTLYSQLDFDRNGEVDYSVVPVKSSEMKLFWKCDLGHSFDATVKNRFNGRGCPFCANRRLLVGFNDFASVYPDLVEFWNDDNISPSGVVAGSSRIVSWKCGFGHEYNKNVEDRVSQKIGCPVCSGGQVLVGFNNIGFTHTGIAEELEDSANADVLMQGTSKVVSWRCKAGHVYDKRVNERTRKESRGCPICLASNGESELSDWLSTLGFKVVKNSRKIIAPLELDVFFPEKNIAVEFNGLYWHSERHGKDSKYHLKKTQACKEKNIQLIHVWECMQMAEASWL